MRRSLLILNMCVLLVATVCGQGNWIDEAVTGWYDDNPGEEVFEISTAEELAGLAVLVNNKTDNFLEKTIKLVGNITLNEDVLNRDGTLKGDGSNLKEWTPIGTGVNFFQGDFDGEGHTVSGVYINKESEDFLALFGSVGSDGEIKNVGVVNSYVSGRYDVSGVCGRNIGLISNCYNASYVSGNRGVGGVCGRSSTLIRNSYNTGSISGKSYVAGVCGANSSGSVKSCYNIGSVMGEDRVGGVCGGNYGSSLIRNSYNAGWVTGVHSTGGVYGDNSDLNTVIQGCHYLAGTAKIGAGSSFNEASSGTPMTAERLIDSMNSHFDEIDGWIGKASFTNNTLTFPTLLGGRQPEVKLKAVSDEDVMKMIDFTGEKLQGDLSGYLVAKESLFLDEEYLSEGTELTELINNEEETTTLYLWHLGEASVVRPLVLSRPKTPTALVEKATTSSIRLKKIANAEYRLGNGSWQTSPVFYRLALGTEYTFSVRIRAGATSFASLPSDEITASTLRVPISYRVRIPEQVIGAIVHGGGTFLIRENNTISFSIEIDPAGTGQYPQVTTSRQPELSLTPDSRGNYVIPITGETDIHIGEVSGYGTYVLTLPVDSLFEGEDLYRSGVGVSVSPPSLFSDVHRYPFGTEVTLQVVSDPYRTFVEWMDGSRHDRLAFRMREDMEAFAWFRRFTPVGNEDIEAVGIRICTESGGTLIIETPGKLPVSLYTLTGQCFRRLEVDGTERISGLPPGSYLVVVGSYNKVVIVL